MLLLLGALPAPAGAFTSLGQAEHRLDQVKDRLHERRIALRGLRRELHTLADRTQLVEKRAVAMTTARRRTPDESAVQATGRKLAKLKRQRQHVRTRIKHTVRATQRVERSAASVEDDIWKIRPLGACPVRGSHQIADDFGAARWDDGKYHSHQGNDIFAAYGTPVIAPFDGRAVATPNGLGGLAVKVYGVAGYTYNAHLSRYGKLGTVQFGDVVGYVGATGNAQGTSPHDHFEWHPGGGGAVDPNPLLMLVC